MVYIYFTQQEKYQLQVYALLLKEGSYYTL